MAGKILNTGLLKKIVFSVIFTGFGAMLSVQAHADGEASKSQPSDKVVSRLMTMTWGMLPEKTNAEDEKGAIVIDKTKPKEVLIPTKDARRIIQRAYLTGKAQQCDLRDLQVANYRDMMKAEIASGKWSGKQLFYINQLHLVTVMLQLGNIKVGKPGAKVKHEPSKTNCSPVQAARVAEVIKKTIGSSKIKPVNK